MPRGQPSASAPVEELPPRWDGQTWYWLAFWLVALGCLLGGFVAVFVVEDPEPYFPLILMGLILCSAGGILWSRWRRWRKRGWALVRLIRRREFSYRYHVPGEELEKDIPPFPLFKTGKGRKAQNLIGGTLQGVPFVLLDYHYEAAVQELILPLRIAALMAGAGDAAVPVQQTVVAFPRLPVKLPDFRLVPLGWTKKSVDRLSEMLHPVDLGTQSDPDFQKSYAVEGEPADLMCKVFSRTIQAHLARDPRWYVECLQGQLLIFRAGRLCDTQLIEQRLEKSVEIAQLLTRTGPFARASSGR